MTNEEELKKLEEEILSKEAEIKLKQREIILSKKIEALEEMKNPKKRNIFGDLFKGAGLVGKGLFKAAGKTIDVAGEMGRNYQKNDPSNKKVNNTSKDTKNKKPHKG